MGGIGIWVADVAPEPLAGTPLWGLLLLVVLLLAGAVGWYVGRARASRGAERPTIEQEARGALPAREARPELDAPVEITEGMSLREVREAKQVRLRGDAKGHDAVRQEQDRRRGVGRTARGSALLPELEGETDAPSERGAPDATDDVARDPSSEPPATKEASEAPALEPTDGEPGDPGDVEPSVPAERDQSVADDGPTAPGDSTPSATEGVEPTEESAGTALVDGLARTRSGFVARLGALFRRPRLDEDTLEELEEVLFTADIGVRTSEHLLRTVQQRVRADAEVDPSAVWATLREEVTRILKEPKGTLAQSLRERPTVVLMVGVNGAGKTTTIGKLAAAFVDQGKRVLLVAADTFRAAAVDQLSEWGERTGCDVYRAAEGADPSGVVFDGLQKARNEGYDVVLCDTAGRLQNKRPLMDELEKILRVANKAIPGAPHESILVVDANTGQNALEQARQFGSVAKLTGVVLTKLDGTAKGGVVIGISNELKLPIYFVGIGEAVEDLRRFDPAEFAEALF